MHNQSQVKCVPEQTEKREAKYDKLWSIIHHGDSLPFEEDMSSEAACRDPLKVHSTLQNHNFVLKPVQLTVLIRVGSLTPLQRCCSPSFRSLKDTKEVVHLSTDFGFRCVLLKTMKALLKFGLLLLCELDGSLYRLRGYL
ncbi:hypothetical protein E5288_WYG009390 [Bos mutus]|uniref:Uncharacterized protein n=1 Tax=Bos mutus TaxID=72004 RepID=A0A6B0RC14_9CETA|nr:hypothetical protein [Bos mutus]